MLLHNFNSDNLLIKIYKMIDQNIDNLLKNKEVQNQFSPEKNSMTQKYLLSGSSLRESYIRSISTTLILYYNINQNLE